jgi:hypothetical protein
VSLFCAGAKDLRSVVARVSLTACSDSCAILSVINDGDFFRFINKPWPSVDLPSTIAAVVKASGVDYVKEAVTAS